MLTIIDDDDDDYDAAVGDGDGEGDGIHREDVLEAAREAVSAADFVEVTCTENDEELSRLATRCREADSEAMHTAFPQLSTTTSERTCTAYEFDVILIISCASSELATRTATQLQRLIESI